MSDSTGPNIEQIEAKVIDVIAKAIRLGADGADPIARETLFADLSLDSIDRVEILLELEDEFDLSILDGTIEGWKTVGDAIDYLAQMQGTKA